MGHFRCSWSLLRSRSPTKVSVAACAAGDTETLGATATSASFNSRNVAAANLVTVNGVTLSDGTNGGLASNYSLAAGQTAVAHITPRTLTVNGTVAGDKFFDGTTIATLSGSTLVGVLPGDGVTLASSGAFASPAIGFDIPVTVTSALQGAAASNYALTPPASLLLADILAPRPLVMAYGYTATIATRPDDPQATRLWSYEPDPVPLKVADEPPAAGH